MEKMLCITKVMPLEERQYVKDGEQKRFVSRQLILTDGIDTICAEIIGETARREDWPLSVWANVQLVCKTREYQDKNEKTRVSNEFQLIRIGL